MKKTRTLSLRRETIADLSSDDLRSVVGGIITEHQTQCLTPMIFPQDWTYPCSYDC